MNHPLMLLSSTPARCRMSGAAMNPHRPLLLSVMLAASVLVSARPGRAPVVADSLSRMPLPAASVFDCRGRLLGMSASDGSIPPAAPADYPLVVRYMGFDERTVRDSYADTVFMTPAVVELPDFVVESRNTKVMHLLAYVREYSTLSAFTDTVALFREKMVDYMLPSARGKRFKGWTTPRILSSKSYYRFTDAAGRDSVSDRCGHHFSWTDWIGIAPAAPIPPRLAKADAGADTVQGRYTISETWVRNADRLTLDVNVLADTVCRRWVPNIALFFRRGIDFERLRMRANYAAVGEDSVGPANMTGYSFNIESNGRGRGMFMFNRVDEPFSVSTYAEVYIVDREYISVAEARKWERNQPHAGEIGIYVPPEAPHLQPDVLRLIARVDSLDHDRVRLDFVPDRRLAGCDRPVPGVGERILQRIKGMFGISDAVARRKWNNSWREFRRNHRKK